MRRWLWFFGLYLTGVIVVAGVAYAIRLMIL